MRISFLQTNPLRWAFLWLVMVLIGLSAAALGQAVEKVKIDQQSQPAVSSLGIVHPPDRAQKAIEARDGILITLLDRTIDGSFNNLLFTHMGATFTRLRRVAFSDYADGISELAGPNRMGPREISNAVCAQTGSIPNTLGASDFLWQWGQFVDHDIDLTDVAEPAEPEPIQVPTGDPFFDPSGTGNQEIGFNRSIFDENTGTSIFNPRQQLNEITAWIDGSNVYGSDEARAGELRTFSGGRLKSSAGDLLPFNVNGFPNAGGPSPTLFLAGDVRSNEQVGLTAMHTLFLREHNRLADQIQAAHPSWNDELVYRAARRIVGAEIQVITYNEFLPALLGPNALSPYSGYKLFANGAIINGFSVAVYRFGHSALSPTLLRLDATGTPIAEGNLALRDAFFAPQRITDEGGIAPILRGLANQLHQRVDPFIVDDVRNFLFGPPGSGGFDLASLNIQRGRDHGVPGYNDMRHALGLPKRTSFSQISSDADVVSRLSTAYASVDDIDLWVGGLSEDPLNGGHVGEVMFALIKKQFEALRDADRFWYQIALLPSERALVDNVKLSDIIRRNTGIGAELTDDAFHVQP